MKFKKWQKILFGILTALFLLVILGGTYLKVNTYSPSNEARNISTQSIKNNDYLLFSTAKSKINFIFYPGALVKPESYSIWASELAHCGINVYIMKMPLNLAVFGENAAEKIITNNPQEIYLLGGHSLGGVMASRFTVKHQKEVSGVIYLASYPDKKGSLKETSLPVLVLSASKDGLVSKEDISKSQDYLPESTTFEVIKGGNHSGFGSYGAQKNDGMATISKAAQKKEMTQRISEWVEENF